MMNGGPPQAGLSWPERWSTLLEGYGFDLRRGRSFARRGRVQALEVQVGRVTAEVQDRDLGACDVEVLVSTFNDEEWNRVMDSLGSQAIYAAQLLAGDLPLSIEEIFAGAGVNLLPAGRHELEFRCSACEAWEQPCKHAAAVLYLVGQMLDDDPWLLFRLRGRDRQQVLQALRQRRSDANAGSGPALTAPALPNPAQSPLGHLSEGKTVPLAAQIESFWGRAKDLRELHHHIGPPTIRLALLRRLGRPPFREESLETYDQLSEIYQRVSAEALALAFAPEPEEEE